MELILTAEVIDAVDFESFELIGDYSTGRNL
jgi:hypothetical protein